MDQTQAIAVVSSAPFRALVAAATAVAHSRGMRGVGADVNRMGGKAAVVQYLCAKFGVEALAAELTRAQGAASGGGSAPAPTQGDNSGPGGEAHGDSQSDGAQGDGEQSQDDGAQDDGAQDGGAQGDGEQSQGDGEQGDGEQSPPQAPELPPPPPAGQEPGPDPLSQQVYAIAQRAASEAVTPIRDYLSGPLAEYVEHVAKQRAASGAPGVPFAPMPGHDLPPPAQGTAHPLTAKLLALAAQGEQVLLVGGAGGGKSTAARAVATALGRTFGMLSLSGGVSESSLTGWLLPVGEAGRFHYVPSDFVSCYGGARGPAVFLFDEIDAADPSVAVQVNSALANGVFAVPQRHESPMIERGDCLVIGAANTMGDGAGSGAYSARGALDAATLDRFYILQWEASEAFERALLLGEAAPAQWTPAHDWAKLSPAAQRKADASAVEWVHAVRAKARETGIDRVVSVRMAQRFMRALRAGIGSQEAKRDLLAAWSADERARLGFLAPK